MRKTILFAISFFLFSISFLLSSSKSNQANVLAQSCPDMTCSYLQPAACPSPGLEIVTGHSDSGCTGLNTCGDCKYWLGCSLVECYKPFTTTVWDVFVERLSARFSESDLPTQIVTAILPAILEIAGFISIIIIIISGIQFISSSGNPEGAAAARGRLTFALVGFAVIVLAFLVLQIIDRVFLQTRVV